MKFYAFINQQTRKTLNKPFQICKILHEKSVYKT